MIMPESNLLQIMFLGIVEIAFDKIVNFTIHDSLYVACAVVSPVVFYKSIGLEYVGADLAAPGNVLLGNGVGLLFLLLLLLIILIELGPEHLEGYILIHILASFVLALDHYSCGIVGDSD